MSTKMSTKICSECNKKQDISQFYRIKNNEAILHNRCISCKKISKKVSFESDLFYKNNKKHKKITSLLQAIQYLEPEYCS